MKTLFALILAALCGLANAQTYLPSDCAITYRNDRAWQGQLTARVGAIPANLDYAWAMGVGFTVPAGDFSSAKLVLPTIGSAVGSALSVTYYLTILPTDSATNACAGYGQGYPAIVKPKRDTSMTILAATIIVPTATADLEFTLNAKALAILRAAAGDPDGVVLGVSALVPRLTVYPVGEDPKKVNQPTGFSFERTSACRGVASPYCPSLVLR